MFCNIVVLITSIILFIISVWFLKVAYALNRAHEQYQYDNQFLGACGVTKKSPERMITMGFVSLAISVVLFGVSGWNLIGEGARNKILMNAFNF